MMKAAASGTREKMTAGAAGNKNEATAAGTKGGSAKTLKQELQEAEKNIKAAAAGILKAAAAGTKRHNSRGCR